MFAVAGLIVVEATVREQRIVLIKLRRELVHDMAQFRVMKLPKTTANHATHSSIFAKSMFLGDFGMLSCPKGVI